IRGPFLGELAVAVTGQPIPTHCDIEDGLALIRRASALGEAPGLIGIVPIFFDRLHLEFGRRRRGINCGRRAIDGPTSYRACSSRGTTPARISSRRTASTFLIETHWPKTARTARVKLPVS